MLCLKFIAFNKVFLGLDSYFFQALFRFGKLYPASEDTEHLISRDCSKSIMYIYNGNNKWGIIYPHGNIWQEEQ